MAKYTTEVRTICEHFAGLDESVGFNDIDEVVSKSYDKIFTDFPIFDEAYRQPLCTKILKHYYTREIGAESFGLWKLMLNRRMCEIMPYYNKLYNSELITIDPLKNYKGGFNRTLNKTGSSLGSEVSTGTNAKTGTVDHLHTGGYEDTDDHTNTHIKSGSKENLTTGNVTNGMAGTETNTRNGVVTNENTKEGSTIDTRTGKSGDVNTTFVDLFTDTPQGNIDNMGDGYHFPDGTPTDVPIVGTNTAYLTTAEKTSNSVSDRQVIENTRAYSDDYKDTNTTTYDDLEDVKSYNNRVDTKTYNNLKEEETYKNITDSDTYHGETERVYKNDDVLDTYNLHGTNSGSVEKSGSTTGRDVEELIDGGYKGISESELLELYRKTFLNIDLDIIRDLKDLFMLVW